MATTKYLYLKQCPGTDAEPGLPDGAAGPASFRDANGALLWVPAPNGGALVVKHTEFGHGISRVEFVADELSTETGVHLRLSGLLRAVRGRARAVREVRRGDARALPPAGPEQGRPSTGRPRPAPAQFF